VRGSLWVVLANCKLENATKTLRNSASNVPQLMNWRDNILGRDWVLWLRKVQYDSPAIEMFSPVSAS